MPQDLYDHVHANMTWRDDLFVFGVYAPCVAVVLFVLAVLWVVCAPIDWAIRRLWRSDDTHPINRWWTGW